MRKERPSTSPAKRTSAKTARNANTNPTSARSYVLPEDAHAALLRASAQLELLTRLTVARITHDLPELELSPDALLHCLHRTSREIETVVKAARLRRSSPG